jgi:hypothetical protein
MYDPATANASSHRGSPARTYIMNVLGLTKTGFVVDMPNRYRAARSPVAYQDPSVSAAKYNPQSADYVSQKWDLNPQKAPGDLNTDPYKAPPETAQAAGPSSPGINYDQVHKMFDWMGGADKGKGFMSGGAIQQADFIAGGIISQKDMVKDAKLDVVNKPKPKKLQEKQGLTQKKVAPTVTNRNYYQPPVYQSQVKSLNIRGGYG